MKKNITLMILMAAFGSMSVYTQPLENTIWTVDDPGSSFFAYYQFGIDTISMSFDNITYINTSTYQVSGNTLTTVALYDEDCLVADTGRYTFLIQNDTLKFTLVNDQCTQRVIALTTFDIVRYQTGIQSLNILSAIKFYPNPASTTFTILTPAMPDKNTFLTIYSISGQQLIKRRITEQQTILDVSGLVQGVYLVRMADDQAVKMGKFVVNH